MACGTVMRYGCPYHLSGISEHCLVWEDCNSDLAWVNLELALFIHASCLWASSLQENSRKNN